MNKTIILLASCMVLVFPAVADAGRNRGEWADYSSLLLFDSQSGRLMDMMVPKPTKSPFHIRDDGSIYHILNFQNWIHIDRPLPPMLPGTTTKIHFPMLGLEGGRMPRFFFDYSVSMRNGEFTGGSCFIWDIYEWKDIPEMLEKQKKIILYSRISNQVTSYAINRAPRGHAIRLDSTLYEKLVARMTNSNSEAFYEPKTFDDGLNKYRKTKLELVRHDDRRLKTSGDDYVFEMLLDRSTGYLTVYLRYRNHEEPKDLDASEIRAMIDPDHLAAAPWNYWADTTAPRDRKIVGAKTDDMSEPAGEGEDTRFTIRVNQVFGTVRPIWELAVWPELGRRIHEDDNAYLLYFNDEDVQDLKRPEISQSYLVVTADLYAAMDALRQAAKEEKR